MPVSVEDGYNQLSPNQSKALSKNFSNDEFPIAMRRYSSARTPTKSGADLVTVHYSNAHNTVDAKLFKLV